jgi:hypothetical protein
MLIHDVLVVVTQQRVAPAVIVVHARHDPVLHEMALARVAPEYFGQHLLALSCLVEKNFHQKPLLLAHRQRWQALQGSHAEGQVSLRIHLLSDFFCQIACFLRDKSGSARSVRALAVRLAPVSSFLAYP